LSVPNTLESVRFREAFEFLFLQWNTGRMKLIPK